MENKINGEVIEQVSAGNPDTDHRKTFMQCSDCKFSDVWVGDFKDGKYYDCPGCGNKTLLGMFHI